MAFGGDNNDTFYVSSLPGNLPTVIDGGARDGGSGNVMVLQDLVNGGSYDLTALANVTNNIDTLNIRGDGAATDITISCQDIQNMVDNNNASELTIRADSGDVLVLAGGAITPTPFVPAVTADYTINDGGQTAVIHWVVA